jgi:two-component system sensor histidine kinase BarA
MNGICGFAELLLTSKDLSDDHREYIQYINKSATMMISLLDDILDITQIEGNKNFLGIFLLLIAGKLTLVNKPFNIVNTVHRVVDMLALLSLQKKIELISFVSPNCPLEVYGDDLRLQQILVNLTSNALKFTEKGWIKVENFCYMKFLGKF